MTAAIAWEGATKRYLDAQRREVVAVDDLTLSVGYGRRLALIGTSGSGKTTSLEMVNRLVEPSAGRVLVGGVPNDALDVIALRRSLGYVVQSGALMPHLDVAANVGLLPRLEGWEPARIRKRVRELLELVHLPPDDYGHRHPAELSGGERQRVGVARALALDPPMLLMDEPFGALDPVTRISLRDEFRDLSRSLGKTIVLVTHDLEEAFALGDEVALLHDGRLCQAGSEDDFRHRPADDFVEAFVQGFVGARTVP
ncbi:MAG: ATP-binding cassette domain-containing protein [Planctomycetes bacterium]|nr:ATP-binding cassette domain-containing protein [Planctomycetota bacterium]